MICFVLMGSSTRCFACQSIWADPIIVRHSTSKRFFLSTQEKIKASKHIFELLSHLKSEIAQEDYLQEVSKNAQISMQSLTKDFVEFKNESETI